jgi:hypothetical protein
MRPGVPNNFILNGFDRSGSSAISRVLATHPDIEIIMQPFNGGSIREKLYQVLDDSNASADDVDFFSKLENSVLEQSYIKSQWHDKHSSVRDFVPGKLHLIKTTQNHLTISWVRRNFPRIENWGIWRKPLHILASLVRNNFHVLWYADAAGELVKTVESNALLNSVFGKYSDMLTNPVREMAFIIATRSWFFFYHLEPGKIIDHQEFSRDPNTALSPVLQYFGLTAFDFGSADNEDLNITGKKYRPGANHLDSISPADHAFCESLFQPLYQLPATSNLS